MKSLFGGIILLAVVACFLVYGAQENLLKRKAIEKVDSLSNISSPKQDMINNTKKEKIMVGDKEVYITKLASYDISGIVLATREYKDEVGSYDVALGWGILTINDNYNKITSWEFEERTVTWKVNDSNWLDSIGGIDSVATKLSHNHLIPSNNDFKRLFTKIAIGDYIRIKGYLVTAQWDNVIWGPSSLVRDDTGCEIIYVEDMKWLKEK